jgi:DNA-binding NarL/FixJ family response regulator
MRQLNEIEGAAHSMNALEGRTAVIVDGHPLWLDALAQLLSDVGISVVARSTRLGEIVDLAEEYESDMLVVGLDSASIDSDLLSAVQKIKSSHAVTKVIMFSPVGDDRAIDAAFSVGVSAFCIKSAAPDDLMAAIRQSFEHSIYLPARRASTDHELTSQWDAKGGEPDLTKREIEILRLVAEGHSNSQLARMLWVTEQTVKFHLSNVYRKLDVANRTEASRWAQVHGLLSSGSKSASQSAA